VPVPVATFAHDADGDRTSTTDISGTTVAYDYDQRNELTRYRNQASTTTTTVGAHVSSSLTSTNPADETYHYNGDGLRADIVWDPTTGIPAILEDKTHLFIYGPGGLPLEQVDLAGNALYYHHDQLGSIRLLTNQDGHPIAYSDYDPYGRPIKPVDAALNPLGFAGQYTDAANGLIYMRARWYDPATGTFLTTDPLGLAGGDQNPYGYAGRDPVNRLDPTGLCQIKITNRNFYGSLAGYFDFEAGTALFAAGSYLMWQATTGISGAAAAIVGLEGLATAGMSAVPFYATYRDLDEAWS
jgi:RHS repeat-associated protein